jgi:glutamate-1-semialdehyde 2,1-aminomutase
MEKEGITKIEKEYISKRKISEKMYQRALKVIPSGIVHDARYIKPFPFYVDKANGARKWDVDGNEIIDLWSGHGALILGHNHPDVLAAVTEQMEKGFHFSACHQLELEISEMIASLIPSAEKVRLVETGTGANMLAIRIARAYTGRNKVIKFRGHFHGYWDECIVGVRPPFDIPMSAGVPSGNTSNVLLVDHNNSEEVRRLIEKTNDVAAVIMDPAGAHAIIMANRPGFVEEVRQITKERGVLLIFDEVISGFRYAPGGAQEILGVTPDLTALGKIIGGGLNMSAVVGKRDIMEVLEFTDDAFHNRFHRVIDQGTHSGSPLACAAGLATLKILKTGEIQAYINGLGAKLRKGMNEIIKKYHIPGCVHGNYSINYIFLLHDCPQLGKCDTINCTFPDHEVIDRGTPVKVGRLLHLANILHGFDHSGGLEMLLLNSALTAKDLEIVIEAFDCSLMRLKEENIIKS